MTETGLILHKEGVILIDWNLSLPQASLLWLAQIFPKRINEHTHYNAWKEVTMQQSPSQKRLVAKKIYEMKRRVVLSFPWDNKANELRKRARKLTPARRRDAQKAIFARSRVFPSRYYPLEI